LILLYVNTFHSIQSPNLGPCQPELIKCLSTTTSSVTYCSSLTPMVCFQ
jgi:hypothetical protein